MRYVCFCLGIGLAGRQNCNSVSVARRLDSKSSMEKISWRQDLGETQHFNQMNPLQFVVALSLGWLCRVVRL